MNRDLVTRKCALEASNNQKDKTISDLQAKIAKFETVLKQNHISSN